MNTDLNKKIESYLFWKGEPINKKELQKIFSIDEATLSKSISEIQEKFRDTGLEIKIVDEKISMTTSADSSEMIDEINKAELNKELSRATLETLAIIIYRAPIRRPEIDYIRGVSSQFILRNLQIRGLIEKFPDPKDSRTYLYKPAIELLNYLGVSKIDELPEYEQVKGDIDNFLHAEEEKQKNEQIPHDTQ